MNDTYSEKLIRVPETNSVINGMVKSGPNEIKGGEASIITQDENQISIPLQPQKASNLYFFTKIKLGSGKFLTKTFIKKSWLFLRKERIKKINSLKI